MTGMSNSLSYVPAYIHSAVSGTRPLQMTLDSVSRTNFASTSSFTYDPMGSPLKSTQQLNVDWSNFQNHVFFSSAEAVVNIAFDRIINGYPFDGTRSEVEAFLESLTGFERWVFDQFPRHRGALGFDSSLGTCITVNDYAGTSFPSIARNTTGRSVINPRSGTSLALEMQVLVPSGANGNQVLAQKTLNGDGFALFLSASAGTTCQAQFSFVSASTRLTTTAPVTKGRFNHLCAVLDRDAGPSRVLLYVDEELIASSSTSFNVGDVNIDQASLTIGSGSTFAGFTPTTTFSGSLDEFRIFHSPRSIDQQKAYAKRNVFATPELRLYYRFNEPAPLLGGASVSDQVNSIVLDSSGNSLHAFVTGFTGSLRQDVDDHIENPVTLERTDTTVILFPAHEDVVDLNQRLLTSASLYDAENPNIITRLIPQHYLEEGARFDGFDMNEGGISLPYTGSGIPGQGERGSTQAILSFLYIWAQFFDDIKLYIDSFRNVRYVDYDTTDTTPNNFLIKLARDSGLQLPPLFNDATVEQYVDGTNIIDDPEGVLQPLRDVQQQLLRRVLINMPDILRSKGTQHSIRAFLRSIGIDPDNSVRIREYGGPTKKQLSFSRESRREMDYMVAFTSASMITSGFLSSSRLEVGYPSPRGTMVSASNYPPHGISNQPSDGLLTSGSWTVEMHVRYPLSATRAMAEEQSLARICTTGSNSSRGGTVFNLVAVSSSTNPMLILYGRPGVTGSSPVLSMPLIMSTGSSSHIFDGDIWNVTFGCERNDEISSLLSSSYFIRVGKTDGRVIESSYLTSSFFYETPQSELNSMRNVHSASNASGSFIVVGAGQSILSGTTSGYTFLNNTSEVTSTRARTTSMNGWMSNLRFWSKALSETEWYEHVRNHRSTGVSDPLTHYNFARTPTGSFGRLRLESLGKQSERYASSAGEITLIDTSLSNRHMTGSGFPASQKVLVGELFSYSYVSPYFDESVSDEKIRIRGFDDASKLSEAPWAGIAPVYEVQRSERPTDDTRLSIEFSLVDALNRDIALMFANFDVLDNAIGDPALANSIDYPDLERLRDIYFNRVGSRLQFRRFFEFYRWFDDSIGTFIEQLVPRKTRFKGTNFTIESHMLERHKIGYVQEGQYLGDSDRPTRNVLLLQQITGVLHKF